MSCSASGSGQRLRASLDLLCLATGEDARRCCLVVSLWLDLTVFVRTARFFTRMCVFVPERKRPDRPNCKGL